MTWQKQKMQNDEVYVDWRNVFYYFRTYYLGFNI